MPSLHNPASQHGDNIEPVKDGMVYAFLKVLGFATDAPAYAEPIVEMARHAAYFPATGECIELTGETYADLMACSRNVILLRVDAAGRDGWSE